MNKDPAYAVIKPHKKIKFRRIILKISGELLGAKDAVFDRATINYITDQIQEVSVLGARIGIVIGGGNIIRGRNAQWFDKIDADLCGMIATMINGIIINSQLAKNHVASKIRGALELHGIVKLFSKSEDLAAFERGQILIFVGGTGNPLFTTDTAAALRAGELDADILIKGTKVEGVFARDPVKDPKAILYPKLSFTEVIRKNLTVMDLAAINICREKNIPICVYDFLKYPLSSIVRGEKIGTLITNGG